MLRQPTQLHSLLLQDARGVRGTGDRLNVAKSLIESAQRCIRTVEIAQAWIISSRLESWVGPLDIPSAHGIQSDVELMLVLERHYGAGQVGP